MNSSSTSSSESREHRRTALRFLTGAILAIALLYVIGGIGRRDDRSWFLAVPARSGGDTLDVLLVGSSRVAAAIDSEIFDSVASSASGRPIRTINLGMGFSTLHEIHFGLRHLARTSGLHGRYVLLEAPGGMPEHVRWDDSWIVGDARYLLSRYLDAGDLDELWTRSEMPMSDKLLVSIEVLTGAKNNFWRLRLVAAARTKDALRKVGELFHRATPATQADLAAKGGIRTDGDDLEKIRMSAIDNSAKMMLDPRPWTVWDSTLVRHIVEEVRRGGGEVGLFGMPLCSYQERVYRTPLRKAGRLEFESFRARWAIPFFETDSTYPDDAYPDLWHLGRPAARDFSRRLAETWTPRGL